MSVKLALAGVGGCALHVAGFDGFSPYCSGARWAQGTVKPYWFQSDSEGERVFSLQQTSSFNTVQFMKTVHWKKNIYKDVGINTGKIWILIC